MLQRILRAIDQYQQRRRWLAFPFAVNKKFGDDQGGYLAALIAYYGFFSLFPLLLVFTSILGSNQGLNIDNSVDPSNFPQFFGAAGSAWFRDPTLPSRPFPATPTYPIIPTTTNSLNGNGGGKTHGTRTDSTS